MNPTFKALLAKSKKKPRAKGGINLYLDREIYDAFKKICENEGSSASEMLDAFMRHSLDPGSTVEAAGTQAPPLPTPKNETLAKIVKLLEDKPEKFIEATYMSLKATVAITFNKNAEVKKANVK